MPVLDTIVLFGSMDAKDPAHKESVRYMGLLGQPEYYLAGFALFEYDIVLKSRGFSPKERMTYHAVMANDHPMLATKVRHLSPETMYMTARLEQESGIDYFDAGVAAEAKMFDGKVVSKDTVFDKLAGLKRIW